MDSERMWTAVVRSEWMWDRSKGPVDMFEGDVNRMKRNCSGPMRDHEEW